MHDVDWLLGLSVISGIASIIGLFITFYQVYAGKKEGKPLYIMMSNGQSRQLKVLLVLMAVFLFGSISHMYTQSHSWVSSNGQHISIVCNSPPMEYFEKRSINDIKHGNARLPEPDYSEGHVYYSYHENDSGVPRNHAVAIPVRDLKPLREEALPYQTWNDPRVSTQIVNDPSSYSNFSTVIHVIKITPREENLIKPLDDT